MFKTCGSVCILQVSRHVALRLFQANGFRDRSQLWWLWLQMHFISWMICPFHPNCLFFFSSGSISSYQTCLLLYFLGLILPRDTSCPFPGSTLQPSIMGINTCHEYGCNQACHTGQENCQIGQYCYSCSSREKSDWCGEQYQFGWHDWLQLQSYWG